MPKPYSYDFRQKVIEAIELDGRKKCEVSEIFNISRNTINLWLKRKEQTGDLLRSRFMCETSQIKADLT
jgi:transposase